MGNSNQSNNKRIAKNTLFLYVRMLFSVGVGLYTSRIVLNALGVSDYGLNNVIAGFISFLGYITGVMNGATSRFLMVCLGENNFQKLKTTFTTCFTIHLLVALGVILLGETIGLWFVNTQLVIDEGRETAANFIYQFALFGSALSFIQAPFQSSIISHEKMNIYAYMSIYDVIAKLLVAYLLLYIPSDKLILYGGTYFLVGLTSSLIYYMYCRSNFQECQFNLGFDRAIFIEIGKFFGWNLVGSFAYIANVQGFNILLNRFFTTAVNGARGISGYITGTLHGFISNFQTAMRPQIMQYCSQRNYTEMNILIMNNAKYSSYLFALICLPTFWETEFLINLWLGQIPQYTSAFLRLTLIQMLITSMSSPMQDGIVAFGRMKWPNIMGVINNIGFLAFVYVGLVMGCNPIQAYALYILIAPATLIIMGVQLHNFVGLNLWKYFTEVLCKTSFIIIFTSIIPLYITSNYEIGWLRFTMVSSSSFLTSAILIYYWGLDKHTRLRFINYMKHKI